MNTVYLEKGRPVEVITRWAQPSKRNPLPTCPDWLIWHQPSKQHPPHNVSIRRETGEIVVRPFRGLRRAT